MKNKRIFNSDDVYNFRESLSHYGIIPIFQRWNGISDNFYELVGFARPLDNSDLDVINFFKQKFFTEISFEDEKYRLKGYIYVIKHTDIYHKENDKLEIKVLSKKLPVSDKMFQDFFMKMKKFRKEKILNYLRELETARFAKISTFNFDDEKKR